MQSEVKRFLRDPDHGRSQPQPFHVPQEGTTPPSIEDEESDIDRERNVVEKEAVREEKAAVVDERRKRKGGRTRKDEDGKLVDVVLSDMCEPWPQTSGFWKRSLSDPYIRMMNTSGINFKDHAGSMVRQLSQAPPPPPWSPNPEKKPVLFLTSVNRISAQLPCSSPATPCASAATSCVNSTRGPRTKSWSGS